MKITMDQLEKYEEEKTKKSHTDLSKEDYVFNHVELTEEQLTKIEVGFINHSLDHDFFVFDEVELPVEPLPKMEVEELEVINIELSDYPLPENPTSYHWWWA